MTKYCNMDNHDYLPFCCKYLFCLVQHVSQYLIISDSCGRVIYSSMWASAPIIQSAAHKVACNYINLLMPNVNYSGCTTPLTSKVAFYIFIQQI